MGNIAVIRSGANNSGRMVFETASAGTVSEKMTILPTGNVGIGTSAPGERLDLRGNLRVGGSTTSNYIAFHGTTGDGPGSFDHGYIGERIFSGTESSELIIFKGNDVEGVSGPDRIRHIAANHVFDTYASALGGSFAVISASTVPTTKMIIRQDGNVGIGTATPSQKLHVVGNTIITGSTEIGDSLQGTAALTTTSTTQTSMFTFAIATYRSAKIVLQASSGSNMQVTELLMVHNGTNIFTTEYGIIKTAANVFTVDTDISSGNARILVTSATATSTSYKLKYELIKI